MQDTEPGAGLCLGLVVDEEFRELLLQGFDFRAIANLNVRVVWIVVSVILMIVLGPVKCFQGPHFGDDWPMKDLPLNQWCYVRIGQVPLLFVGVEDRRTV